MLLPKKLLGFNPVLRLDRRIGPKSAKMNLISFRDVLFIWRME